MKNAAIELNLSHLLSELDTKKQISNIRILFLSHWSMFDKILIANDDYINRIRKNEINPHLHLLNGNPMTQEQADLISENFGNRFRQDGIDARSNWETHFDKSQNYLRVTHLAQTYLFWEERIRKKLLDLIDFSHQDITIDKCNATIRANTFGDLANIRNSLWHSRSGEFGVCNSKKQKFKELTRYIELEKGKRIEIEANQLPNICNHIHKRLYEFPEGYFLDVDTSGNRAPKSCLPEVANEVRDSLDGGETQPS